MAGLQWPISGRQTTQGFAGQNAFEPAGFLANDVTGPRRARTRQFPNSAAFAHLHGAIDIGCPIGTQVVAPEAGEIVAAGTYASTGEHYMMLEVRPGTILFFTHLHTFRAQVGQRVARGAEIARSGNSGMSTGPHLHWEVRVTTRPKPDFRRSGRWFKWNPNRLRVGGDLADLRAIQPPEPPPVPQEIETDPDPPDELSEDDLQDEGDSIGDAAALLDRPSLVITASGLRSARGTVERSYPAELRTGLRPVDEPTLEEIIAYVESTFAGVDVARVPGETFFSVDSEKHWPNFATLMTTDDVGQASDLSRPGVYRLNIVLGRATFDRVVGGIDDPDYTVLDRILPHPADSPERWVTILNPSRRSFETLIKPLLEEAYGILARRRRRA